LEKKLKGEKYIQEGRSPEGVLKSVSVGRRRGMGEQHVGGKEKRAKEEKRHLKRGGKREKSTSKRGLCLLNALWGTGGGGGGNKRREKFGA